MIVHCKRANYDYYIGRPSRYGNPWVIGKDGTRKEVIEKYEKWLRTGENFGNSAATKQKRAEIMQNLGELDGKVLGCWCDWPRENCHGSVLISLVAEDKVSKILSVPAQKLDEDEIPRTHII